MSCDPPENRSASDTTRPRNQSFFQKPALVIASPACFYCCLARNLPPCALAFYATRFLRSGPPRMLTGQGWRLLEGSKLLNKQSPRRHFYSEYWGQSNLPVNGKSDDAGIQGQREDLQDSPNIDKGAQARARCGPATAPGSSSTSEESARDQADLRDELGCGYLLAVFVLRFEDLDPPALGGDEETRGADLGNLSDFALYRPEGAKQVLAAVEDLQLLAVERGPGAGGGIAAAYEVVGEVDVGRPVDFRFGGAAPALVARLAFVLDRFAVLARHHQVGCFQHRLDPHGEKAVEIDAAQRIVGADRRFLLQDHRAFVEAVVRPEDREPGLGIAADERPVDRARATVFGQERRVILDHALLRDLHELLRRELQHIGHDADIGIQCAQRIVCIFVPQRRELVDLDALLLRGDLQEIRLGAFFFGSAKHSGHFVTACKKSFQNGLTKVLLADDRYFHGQAAFFGGTEKAPACLRPAIFDSS